MTILGIFLFNRIRTGGDRRYLELMEGLAERGLKVLVLMNTFLDYKPAHFTKLEFSIQYKYRKFPPASYLFKKTLRKNLLLIESALEKAGGADMIHIHGDTSLKAALFLRKKLKLPLFYAFRCNDIDRSTILRASRGLKPQEYLFSLAYEPINRSREKQVAKYAELVTFQNAADRDCFLKRTGYDMQKTVIIPGNIGLPRCTPEWKDKNSSTTVRNIVYVGSLSASKGLWELLKALGILKKHGYDFLCCRILGRRENEEKTLELIRKLDIVEMISIEGYQSPFPFFASSDILVYPTLYDAFPDTVLEALHTGCPVIASRVGGIPDLLHHSELLFESGNIGEIADRIERCIQDSSFYVRLRNLCAERAEVYRFDWAEQFERAMSSLKVRVS